MLNIGIQPWDERRDLLCAASTEAALVFAAEHWVHTAQRAIQQRGRFAVALSGGSTPQAIYQKLSQYSNDLFWKDVWLFWSDERAVPLSDARSNFHHAMEAGLKHLPIPPSQIFPMPVELPGEAGALAYEETLRRALFPPFFDLMMLGVGADGHTASLFPQQSSVEEKERCVLYTAPPMCSEARMTLTVPCINQSAAIAVYALGSAKASIVREALLAPLESPYPASRVGTHIHKALWILDPQAAANLPRFKERE